jgi:hypothetical protein
LTSFRARSRAGWVSVEAAISRRAAAGDRTVCPSAATRTSPIRSSGGAARGPRPTLAVGSRAHVTRQAGRRELARTEEITELNPPRTWTVHGGGGPLIATAKVTIEPLDAGQRSRVTMALDFKAHGIGRLLLPLVVRRQARKQLPKNQQRLKEVLERGA